MQLLSLEKKKLFTVICITNTFPPFLYLKWDQIGQLIAFGRLYKDQATKRRRLPQVLCRNYRFKISLNFQIFLLWPLKEQKIWLLKAHLDEGAISR